MKIKQRGPVLESNSSSSHSIVIADNPTQYDSISPDADGVIVLAGGQFGWEIESYSDPYTKANYCAVDKLGNDDRLDMLKKVICEHTGAKEVIIDIRDDGRNYSYIDHQSAETSNGAFKTEQTLKDFIFGRGSVLYTDNDNH